MAVSLRSIRFAADLGHVEWTRRPTRWSAVGTSIARSRVPPDIQIFEARDLGISVDVHNTFRRDPIDQYFLVMTERAGMFLVNTEGYGYARYVARIREG